MNDLEKQLVGRLERPLYGKGFKWLSTREMFVRKESFGFSSLVWTANPASADGGRLEIGPVLGVRHDVVDDVVNEIGLVYGDKNKRYTTTVSRAVEFFPFREGGDEKRYIRLSSPESDVESVSAEITALLDGDGEVFFGRYSSLLECSRGLNEPVRSLTHPLCNNFPRRAYYGVAAAFFTEKRRVPDLVREYLEFAESEQPSKYSQISGRFEKLIEIAERHLDRD
jgi:hypothetical protein